MVKQIENPDAAFITLYTPDGQEVVHDIVAELSMSENTINQDIIDNAARYAEWATRLSEAKEKQREKSTALDYVRATLANYYRDNHAKASVAVVNDYVITQDAYQSVVKEYDAWSTRVEQLNYVVRAFEQRANLLSQLGAQLRRSLDNQL